MRKNQPPPTAAFVLLDILDCAFDKQSWHGANPTGALRGVTPVQAAARVPGRKTVWEQLLHAAYWKHRALTKLAVRARFPRAGSNWPAMPDQADDSAWRGDLEMLREVHRRLRGAVADLTPADLDANTVWLVYGAAEQDVYHAGQIQLLRRLARE